jgi:hypothetical protein
MVRRAFLGTMPLSLQQSWALKIAEQYPRMVARDAYFWGGRAN